MIIKNQEENVAFFLFVVYDADMLEPPPTGSEQDKAEALLIAFSQQVQQLNTDYPYWDKAKRLNADPISPTQLWFALKWLRQSGRTLLKFGKYTFSYTINDEILESLHHFDMNIGGSLTHSLIIPTENKNTYLISSIMEEAIASSQMEGAATTRKVAKDMLRKKEKPRDKSQQMILNNYRTIQYIKEHAEDCFSIEKLKEIHRLMTENTLDNEQESGAFRNHNDIIIMDNITGDVAHVPPDYNTLEELLADVELFFNRNSSLFIHPIIKAIIIHFIVSYIHPFIDGNGRTARALFYWYMVQHGYWLIEYISISRSIYKTKKMYERAFLYTEYDENDLTYFILYHLRTMKKAFEELKVYLKRKTEENKSISLLTTIKGINARQAQIIQMVKEKANIMFTVSEIENRFGISNFTARSDLEGLVKIDLLSVIQLNKVKKSYVKSQAFDSLIARKSKDC